MWISSSAHAAGSASARASLDAFAAALARPLPRRRARASAAGACRRRRGCSASPRRRRGGHGGRDGTIAVERRVDVCRGARRATSADRSRPRSPGPVTLVGRSPPSDAGAGLISPRSLRISTRRSASSSFEWQKRESCTPRSNSSSDFSSARSPSSSVLTIVSSSAMADSKSLIVGSMLLVFNWTYRHVRSCCRQLLELAVLLFASRSTRALDLAVRSVTCTRSPGDVARCGRSPSGPRSSTPHSRGRGRRAG